jgi:hypothetical protein
MVAVALLASAVGPAAEAALLVMMFAFHVDALLLDLCPHDQPQPDQQGHDDPREGRDAEVGPTAARTAPR